MPRASAVQAMQLLHGGFHPVLFDRWKKTEVLAVLAAHSRRMYAEFEVQIVHSGLAPDALMILPIFCTSERTNCANASGVPPTASMP